MTIIKQRRDTAANFTAQNTLLADGERAIETDTGKEKIGPGYWNSLSYLSTGSGVPTSRTVNGQALSADVTLAATDVGAVPTARQVNGHALSGDLSLTPADIGAAPTSRSIAGLDLTADRSASAVKSALALSKTDVGLGSVDNTADTSKPVSAAQQAAFNAKQDLASISIAASTVIPLDTPGNGKAMPAVTLSANSAFTVTGAVEGGNCTFALVGDGSHTPDFSAFVIANGYTYNSASGKTNIYAAVRSYGTNLLYGVLGADASVSATKTFGNNTGDDYSGCETCQLKLSTPTTANDHALAVADFSSSDHNRGLIRFPGLSNIPAGATVTAVTLTLNQTAGGGYNTNALYRCRRAWVSASATWNKYDGTNNWGTAGGLNTTTDIFSPLSTSKFVNGTGAFVFPSTAALVADVQAWVDGAANNGWEIGRITGGDVLGDGSGGLDGTTDDATYEVYEPDNGTDGSRPKLTVSYHT